jgi:peptide/nickel transport system permease protein
MVAVLLLVSFGVTFLINLTPGNPAYSVVSDQATAQQIAAVDKSLGLNQPFYERYWHWVSGLFHWNFGTSYATNEKVITMIARALPVTAELIAVALIMSLLISIPVGIYCAYRVDRFFDRAWAGVSSVLISFPPFISGIILAYVFGYLLRHFAVHFPVTGWTYLTGGLGSNLWHVFLPALALSFVLIPVYSRMLRSDMVATLQEDYILAARAKGLRTRRILVVHALRQSSFSLLTLAGLSLGALISGAAVVEVIFALPGLGQLMVNSISAKDIPVVQGEVMFIALCYVVINTLVDLGYNYLDPRLRLRTT